MSEKFFIEELPNGLTLLGQQMEHVGSAAMTFVVPSGAAHDPAGAAGAACVTSEWCFRGAGHRNTRQLNDALDALGCRRHETVRSEHICFSVAQLGRNLGEVLAIYADILRRPALADDTFEPCRALTLQDLASLEDEPARKCNMLLREKFYPVPLGRCAYGTADSLTAMTAGTVRNHTRKGLDPRGTILATAGNIDWEAFVALAEQHLGDWASEPAPQVTTRPAPGGIVHIAKDSAQTHITLAHRTVPITDERYYAARVAETILSGGMSSRLFTEVREKRGLVYHVSSRYHSLKDHAGMFTYAGTVPEKAQETFDTTIGELRRLGEGVQEEEMARARTQLKSSLIMQGESTAARAGALAADWYHLKRLRSLEELSDAIDGVTARDVLTYLRDCPAENFTVLVIGPQPVDTSSISG